MLLNQHNLKMAEFCSSDETRPRLRELQIRKDATIATDAHILVKTTLPDIPAEDFPKVDVPGFQIKTTTLSVPAASAKEALKNLKAVIKQRTCLPILENVLVLQNGDSAQLVATDLETKYRTEFKIPDSKPAYPATDSLFPTTKPKARLLVNP